MAETTNEFANASGSGNEPVCIDARRVYDSCGDKDCLSDLQVYFTEEGQQTIDSAVNIRLRDADVINVLTDIEPVPFHRGFYSIDMTYFFEVTIDAFTSPCTVPTAVKGLCISDKKVILYGSEGNVRVFSSDMTVDDFDVQNLPGGNMPLCNVQVARPIALAATVSNGTVPNPVPCKIPAAISTRLGGEPVTDGERQVFATIGVFSIVQLCRNVQMLIPSYDFCIPEKSCVSSTDSPCEMFSKIDFPTDAFFPPNMGESNENGSGCGCGCTQNN